MALITTKASEEPSKYILPCAETNWPHQQVVDLLDVSHCKKILYVRWGDTANMLLDCLDASLKKIELFFGLLPGSEILTSCSFML